MIAALIFMHFFGGGSPELFSSSDFRDVSRAIEEPERAEVATEAMERMNELRQNRDQARQKYVDEVFTLREHMTRDEWQTAFGSDEE